MGILTSLKKMISRSDNEYIDSDSYENLQCTVYAPLTKIEYKMAEIIYYKGHTSYRSFYRMVYFRNAKKVEKIMLAAANRAEQGCLIENTIVRFFYDERSYIEIPFNVFSNKRNMKRSIRSTKEWDKVNLRRLLRNNPKLRNLDDKILRESIKSVIIENLKG